MTIALVIPFPATRRRSFIRRHAARMAALPERTAEKHLAHQLNVQVETMHRRGIPADVIECERRSLEAAIRAELQRLYFGGVA
jgi:hypothetical protein